MLVYVNQVFQKQISVKLNTIVKKEIKTNFFFFLRKKGKNQTASICSKVTVETPEQDMKYVQR